MKVALTIPGIPISSRPPVKVGDDWWDANSWEELERRLERSRRGEATFISDEEFVRELGLTSDQLIRDLNMSDDEIEREFGMSREELANSLGLPRDDERISA